MAFSRNKIEKLLLFTVRHNKLLTEILQVEDRKNISGGYWVYLKSTHEVDVCVATCDVHSEEIFKVVPLEKTMNESETKVRPC